QPLLSRQGGSAPPTSHPDAAAPQTRPEERRSTVCRPGLTLSLAPLTPLRDLRGARTPVRLHTHAEHRHGVLDLQALVLMESLNGALDERCPFGVYIDRDIYVRELCADQGISTSGVPRKMSAAANAIATMVQNGNGRTSHASQDPIMTSGGACLA